MLNLIAEDVLNTATGAGESAEKVIFWFSFIKAKYNAQSYLKTLFTLP